MFEFSQQLKFAHQSWSDFKKYIDGTFASLAFQFEDKSDYYKIITEQYGGIHQTYDLLKDSGADQTDFDNNFKNLSFRKPGSINIISGSGTAGNPDSNVITIQGIISGTPVPISGSISATNPSVSNINSAPPSSATYISANVNTSDPTYTNGNASALSLTTSGRLRVDGSGVTQPISGTITANAGTGNFTVVQSTASNLNANVSGTVTANAGTGVFDVTPNTPVATEYLPIRLSNGTSFYNAGAAPAVSFTAVSLSTVLANNKSMISIVNANGSNVIAKIYKIYIINSQTSAVTGIVGSFQIKRCTNHSAGTLITPETLDTSDTISSNITIRTGSTISGESALNLWFAKYSTDEWGAGGLDVEASDHINQQLTPLWNSDNQSIKPITLRANEGLTVKFATNSTAGSFDILIVFTQE
jgi:hypothetical protein